MFRIALSLVLSGDDDGKAVLFAEPIADTADKVIAPFVGMVVMIVCEADRIKDQVIMDMAFINMGGKDKLILATQDFLCKLHTDFVGLFWRGLPRLESLYQMAAQVRTLVDSMAASPGKLNIGGFRGAANGGHQKFPVRLGGITDIVKRLFQRRLNRMCLCNCHI